MNEDRPTSAPASFGPSSEAQTGQAPNSVEQHLASSGAGSGGAGETSQSSKPQSPAQARGIALEPLSSSSAPYAEDSAVAIDVPAITLPKGGGALQSMSEGFQMGGPTGTGGLSIPFAATPSRSLTPGIAVSYDTGAGNGAFGLGWQLSVASVSRRTDRGVPRYQDIGEGADTFVMSGAEELVPAMEEVAGDWQPLAPRDVSDAGVDYRVYHYRPRVESTFARIERWVRKSDGDVHWRSHMPDNSRSIYGLSPEARIADPEAPWKVFRWLQEQRSDDRGNLIRFSYRSEDLVGVDRNHGSEQARLEHSEGQAQKYLAKIEYGNRVMHQAGDWMFSVVFDYGDLDGLTANSTGAWPQREDVFSSHRPGFDIRTRRLCHAIRMYHHFPDKLPFADTLVHETRFEYENSPTATLLIAAQHRGYRWQSATEHTSESLPAMRMLYATAELGPDLASGIRSVDAESHANMPVGVDGSLYRLIDLDGEGLPGILTEQAGTWYYKRPLGAARFAAARVLPTMPSSARFASGHRLLDLDGDGRKSLVSMSGSLPGVYERDGVPEGGPAPSDTHTLDGWKPFRPFTTVPPVDVEAENVQMVDLNGDGLADILVDEHDRYIWYPSHGQDGYGEAQRIPKPTDGLEGPQWVYGDPHTALMFADMSGDGLQDIVRITAGRVAYWPSLGYGRFGAEVVMTGVGHIDAPDQFDASRLRVGDFDGSGTTDLAYLAEDGLRIWLNCAGNHFEEGPTIEAISAAHGLANVQLADLFGKGTSCIVWSSQWAVDEGRAMRYLDLQPQGKPYLLREVDNGMGALTRVAYTTSTLEYLRDRDAGRVWSSKLASPVHLVQKVESLDRVTSRRFSSAYSYHHGYYDGAEREYRGFACVEQVDTEALGVDSLFDELLDGPGSGEGMEVDERSYVPPTRTKTWYHTGAFVGQHTMSRMHADEYWRADPKYADYLVPDTVLDVGGLSSCDMREAARTLRGKALRVEVFAEDGTEAAEHPYTVTETNYRLKVVQPRGVNEHGVFLCVPGETIACNYERNPNDPRVSQQALIEVDEFGFSRRSVSVVYPRRSGPDATADQAGLQTALVDGQGLVHVSLSETELLHQDSADATQSFRLGLPLESRAFEVLLPTELPPPEKFSFADLLAMADAAQAVEHHEQDPHATEYRKRLLSHSRQVFTDETDFRSPLPFGSVGAHAIPYELLARIGAPEFIRSVLEDSGPADAGEVDALYDSAQGGYRVIDGQFWLPSGRVHVDPARFFLVDEQISPFEGRTPSQIEYEHDLVPHRFVDPLGYESTLVVDYHTLKAVEATNINGNRQAIELDALGMVRAVAVMGKVGETDPAAMGDTLAEPTQSFEYGLGPWSETSGPLFVHSRVREEHGAANTRLLEARSYFDGAGQVYAVKLKAEDGEAARLAADGSVELVETNDRWVGSGRKVLDNKGNVIEAYEPYFVEGVQFDSETALTQHGVTARYFYDPVGRNVRTEMPDGSYARVEFSPWQVTSYDSNDTVADSAWAAERQAGGTLFDVAEERDALSKALVHADTPSSEYLDSLGRAFVSVVRNRRALGDPVEQLETRAELDVEGNLLRVLDARGNEAESREYTMSGQVLRTSSVDAGTMHSVVDIGGKPLVSWGARGQRHSFEYDEVDRPVAVRLGTGGEAKLLQLSVYGDGLADAQARNLRGHLHHSYDSAGLATVESLDFKGMPELQTRRLLADPEEAETDWTAVAASGSIEGMHATAAATKLEDTGSTVYESRAEYDALGRAVVSTLPDGSVQRSSFNARGLPYAVELEHVQGGTQTLVERVEYDAKGQRTLVVHGADGVESTYEYDERTFRLRRMQTTRPGPVPELQDLRYFYDPVGNITRQHDASRPTTYFRNQAVEAANDYTYDALYRLIRATGREHESQGCGALPTHEDPWSEGRAPAGDDSALRPFAQGYWYDEVGNLSKVRHEVNDSQDCWTREYAYEADGNRLKYTKRPSDLAPTVDEFAYDAHGNMTAMPGLSVMSWTSGEALAYSEGGVRVWYQYDGGGTRVRKFSRPMAGEGTRKERVYLGGFEIYRAWNGAGELQERTETLNLGGVLVERKTVEGGASVSQSPGYRFQLGNHQGSVTLEVDAAGKVISWEEYHPYGTTAFKANGGEGAVEVTAKRYRYTGLERDEETGLGYHGARYYAAWLGRWTACDPIGLGDGVNRYGYVRGNPVRGTDRGGTQTSSELDYSHHRSVGRDGVDAAALATEEFSGGRSNADGTITIYSEQGDVTLGVSDLQELQVEAHRSTQERVQQEAESAFQTKADITAAVRRGEALPDLLNQRVGTFYPHEADDGSVVGFWSTTAVGVDENGVQTEGISNYDVFGVQVGGFVYDTESGPGEFAISSLGGGVYGGIRSGLFGGGRAALGGGARGLVGLDPVTARGRLVAAHSATSDAVMHRFLTLSDESTFLPPLRHAGAFTRARVNLMMHVPGYRSWRAQKHMEGFVRNSPFVSLARDPAAAAKTTDDWLATIITGRPGAPGVKQATDLATFKIPVSKLDFPQPSNVLSVGETEVLYHGFDLQKFMVSSRPNPF